MGKRMNYYTLKTHNENTTLLSGYYQSYTRCIEYAIEQGIDLSHIDLRDRNLSNANLDGANMSGACFTGANLTGTNLSEANLQNSIFNNCSFYNTCFAYSNLQGCHFMGASFGATLIDGTNLQDCIFSTLSCFDLEFGLASAMNGCIFHEEVNGLHYKMSEPPVILKGIINTPIIIMDKVVKIGSQIFTEDVSAPLLKLIENALNQTDSLKIHAIS